MHSVGLKQAEVDALVDLQPTKLKARISHVEKKILHDWVFEKFGGNPEFDKKGVLVPYRQPSSEEGKEYPTTPYAEFRISPRVTRNLISFVAQHIVNEVKRYDPTFDYKTNDTYSSICLNISFPMLMCAKPVELKNASVLQKGCIRRIKTLRRYLKYVQLVAIKNHIPVVLELITPAIDTSKNNRFAPQGVCVVNVLVSFRNAIPVHFKRSKNDLKISPALNLHQGVSPDPYDSQIERFVSYTDVDTRNNDTVDVTTARFILEENWSDERVAALAGPTILFYMESLIPILKSLTRFKDLTEQEL